jgi:hypothetical protein
MGHRFDGSVALMHRIPEEVLKRAQEAVEPLLQRVEEIAAALPFDAEPGVDFAAPEDGQ